MFNFDRSLAELKGFEVKRRGELELIKGFQMPVFEAFLEGGTLDECYKSVAAVANYWLDVLYTRGQNLQTAELFDLLSENRSMSRKLSDYGDQKSTAITCAKRLSDFLGEQMVRDAGLATKFIISREPLGQPVTERAVPTAIFAAKPEVRQHFLRKWLRTPHTSFEIRDILDWDYYIERLGNAIQKIITIPAALQGINNPVPRVAHPDWLQKHINKQLDAVRQRKLTDMFQRQPKPLLTADVEDIGKPQSTSTPARPVITKQTVSSSRKRRAVDSEQPSASETTSDHQNWRKRLGSAPRFGVTREQHLAWLQYHRKKWCMQREIARTTARQQRMAHVGKIDNMSSFVRRTGVTLHTHAWHIVQVRT